MSSFVALEPAAAGTPPVTALARPWVCAAAGEGRREATPASRCVAGGPYVTDGLSVRRGAASGAAVAAASAASAAAFGCNRRKRRQQYTARRSLQPYAIEPINAYMADMKAVASSLAGTGRCILDMGDDPAKLAAWLRQAGAPAADLARSNPAVADPEGLCQAWREVLLDIEGLGEGFSGVVLPPDALQQTAEDGRSWNEIVSGAGVLLGVRAYTGFFPLNGYGELGTTGSVGLAQNCQAYQMRGARFATWRASFMCSMELPTDIAVWECVARLAEFARICQATGLVPVIEIAFRQCSGTQSVERAAFVAEKVFSQAMQQLCDQDVNPEALVFLVSPCASGLDAAPTRPDEAGGFTARTLWRTLPPALPGVHILGGALSAEDSARMLVALREALPNSPWGIALVFDAVLQAPVLARWAADGQAASAREALLGLARLVRQCATAPTAVDV